VSAAAATVVKTILEDGIVDHCGKIGAYFKEKLFWLQKTHEVVREVRGKGLLLGIELSCDGTPVVNACQDEGFLINCTQGNVLRFVPPLIVEEKEIDALIACLDKVLAALPVDSQHY
jgi:acetylornithine/succinyldiaminopimelate/putrescine aminotransferase